MTPKKLAKIKRKLEHLRRKPVGLKSDELISLAKKLGRKKFNTGKEPTWVRDDSPELSPPLSIPDHSADLKPGTARSIIEALLSDVDEWEIFNQENASDCSEDEDEQNDDDTDD